MDWIFALFAFVLQSHARPNAIHVFPQHIPYRANSVSPPPVLPQAGSGLDPWGG
jgi:hypothetical protein